ncbi:hypothetical protein BDFB_004493 [Asbolus verrucosus]|uniref:Uncharacterized protein n=1 Tax=Asbolus verrucosus TaxID=1661398 RepID=A0A482VV14_ASBVE|nr:hypothetical protein BDFB_004493 [Asbolus verrucosus]
MSYVDAAQQGVHLLIHYPMAMPHRHRTPPASRPVHGARNMCSSSEIRSPSEIRPFRGLIAASNENYKLPESLLTRRSNYLTGPSPPRDLLDRSGTGWLKFHVQLN